MLLVLGRPGAGCSTFLKVIGNQRAGYERVDGQVTYGGADAETMAKRYRSEGVFLVPFSLTPVNRFFSASPLFVCLFLPLLVF